MGASFEIKGQEGREMIPVGQVRRRLANGCSFVSKDEQLRYEASVKETLAAEAEAASGETEEAANIAVTDDDGETD